MHWRTRQTQLEAGRKLGARCLVDVHACCSVFEGPSKNSGCTRHHCLADGRTRPADSVEYEPQRSCRCLATDCNRTIAANRPACDESGESAVRLWWLCTISPSSAAFLGWRDQRSAARPGKLRPLFVLSLCDKRASPSDPAPPVELWIVCGLQGTTPPPTPPPCPRSPSALTRRRRLLLHTPAETSPSLLAHHIRF